MVSSKLIGEGFSSKVFDTQNGCVLKVAKVPTAFARMQTERDIVSQLASLSFRTPASYAVIKPCDQFPLGGAFYKYISGKPCINLTRQLMVDAAQALHEIHQLAPTVAEVDFTPWPAWSEFSRYLRKTDLRYIETLFSGYRAPTNARRFVHGDFWPENLISAGGRLVGVLDWEHAGFGDVALDFAALAYLPHEVLEQVLSHYQGFGGEPGEGFPERLKVCRFRRELSGLFHSLENPASGELDDALGKVQQLIQQG